jgi:hypothetical protein
MKVVEKVSNINRSMLFRMLIPNMPFVSIKKLIIAIEINEYQSKNNIFAIPEPINANFGHVRRFFSQKITHGFVARENLH